MSQLRDHLRAHFGQYAVRKLASTDPVALVVNTVSVVLGLSASTINAALASVDAADSTTLRIQDITAHADSDQRAGLIEQALLAGDSDVQLLAAMVLIYYRADLMAALPADTQGLLINGLNRGMQQIGGPLVAIAPLYAVALREPQIDWSNLHPQLQQALSSTRQAMLASGAGVITKGKQSVQGSTGPSVQVMHAMGGSIQESAQEIFGAEVKPASQAEIAYAADAKTLSREQTLRLIEIHTRRLNELEARNAYSGISTPPEIKMEIEDLCKELHRLHSTL
jgi:hypothetical protein